MATRPPYEAQTDSCTYEIDYPSPRDSPEALVEACARVLAQIESLSRDYIWHKQPFQLGLWPESFAHPVDKPQHRYLQGKTDVTDAVDDEWFIVWLLRQLTLQDNDAAVQIEDDDGEFLLIEAADSLPNWVTPQNAANRVWIHRGRLHLVPLEYKSALPFGTADDKASPSFDPEEEGFLDRATALELVRNKEVDTLAPQEVQDAVWARIDGYPAKIREHHHRTLSYLPTEIALALADSPKLIAEAVGAFYERDPGMLKAVNTMSRFPPASSTSAPASSATSNLDADAMTDDTSSSASTLPNPLLVPTVLTRPLYSQLVLQRFYAPKPFIKAGWVEAKRGRDDERRRDLGIKIACGFEMLYQQTAPKVRHPSSGTIGDSFDTTEPKYRAYLKSLADKGFFGDEVEGSEKWKEQERVAREGWLRAKTSRPTLSFAQRVDEAIARSRSRPDPLSERIDDPSTLNADRLAALEDSEDWLSLDEQGLENILSARSSRKGAMLGDSDFEDSSDEDEGEDDTEEGEDGMTGVEGGKSAQEKLEEKKARKAAKRLEAMAGKVEDFVEGRGAVSGALFDDEREEDDADSDDDEQDAAMPEMTAEERAMRMEKLVASLPAEQWGQKPEEVAKAAEAGVAAASAPSLETTADGADASSAGETSRVPRPPKLAKEEYEGASDLEDDSEDEAMPEGEEGLGGSDVEGEEGPSVMNEDDMLDLGEEMDEFLKFATETLGLSEDQYAKILDERRGRGAFVPGPAKEKKVNVMPSAPSSRSKQARFAEPEEPSPAAKTAAGNPPPPRERLRNPNLTDFDSLMEQMEKELDQARSSSRSAASTPSAPSGPSVRPSGNSDKIVVDSLSDSEGDDDDGPGPDPRGEDISAMDAELSQLLKGLTGGGEEGPMDYKLVKNFLDSFQSQGGFAGPAGNLAGRLGFPLPRDAPSQ